MDATEILANARIVPVVVIDDPEAAVPLAETLVNAGLTVIEITLRTPSALESIEQIARAVPQAIVGVGSVRSVEQFKLAKIAGAQFAVSPGATEALLGAAAAHEMPFVPGAVTSSETIRLLECGYTLQKFFPAELSGGVPMLKAIASPIAEVRFFPTGGITAKMAPDYLAVKNVGCIGGSWITPTPLICARAFTRIGEIAAAARSLAE